MIKHFRHTIGTTTVTRAIGTGNRKRWEPTPKAMDRQRLALENEKLKTVYRISERELKRYVRESMQSSAKPVEELLRRLATRLDSIVHLLGFVPDQLQAQRMIESGGIMVNDVVIDDPSYGVTEHDTVALTVPRPLYQLAPAVSWLERNGTSGHIRIPPHFREVRIKHININDVLAYYLL